MKSFSNLRSLLFMGGIFLLAMAAYLTMGVGYARPDAKMEIESLRSALAQVSSVTVGTSITCGDAATIQGCLDNAATQTTIVIPPGTLKIEKGLRLKSGMTLVIEKGAVVTLADSATMPRKGGSVIGIIGTAEEPIRNVTLILNGVIDGNKAVHSYDRSGNEGVSISYGRNIVVFGSGAVQNTSGDGIDIDATRDSVIAGIKVRDNSGSGVHFGTPRPISSSVNNLIVGVESSNNGFLLRRAGVDVSWPNKNSATYAWVNSFSNYKNWDLSGFGASAIRSYSLDASTRDSFRGALVADVNGQNQAGVFKNLDYVVNLFKRDMRLVIGFTDVGSYLRDLRYFR